MDDAGAFFVADIVPADHAMGVVLFGERFPARGQFVEWTAVLPAQQFAALQLAQHLDLAQHGTFERAARKVIDLVRSGLPPPGCFAIVLAHLDVGQLRADGRRHVAGQRPRRRRPDQQRLRQPRFGVDARRALRIHQREAGINTGMGQLLVAVGDDLVLADAGAAAIAPRHDVGALVEPALLPTLLEKTPDLVVVLVGEGKVRATQLGQSQPADDLLGGVGNRTIGAVHGDDLARILGQPVAQCAQLLGVVPVHPVAQADRLLGHDGGEVQHPLLALVNELGHPHPLDVALGGETPFLFHQHLDPEALAVEAVLVALVVALHGFEALKDVLVGASPGVVDGHEAVGRDGAIDK